MTGWWNENAGTNGWLAGIQLLFLMWAKAENRKCIILNVQKIIMMEDVA